MRRKRNDEATRAELERRRAALRRIEEVLRERAERGDRAFARDIERRARMKEA